jgi:hypothetical protein
MRFLVTVAATLLLALLGCTPPAEQPAPDSEDSAAYKADVQAILDLEQRVFDAQIAGDLEAWLSSLFRAVRSSRGER